MMERSDLVLLAKATLDLVRAEPPREPQSTLVRVTSGTAGQGALVLMGCIDPESIDDIDRSWRTISCLGSRSIRLANMLAESRTRTVQQILPVDAADLTADAAALLTDFAPTRLYGLSSFILKLGARLDKPSRSRMMRIRFSGESVRGAKAEHLAEIFPNAEQFEYYIANDVGGFIGRRSCARLLPGQFHLGKNVEVEIHNPDDDGIGDILVSRSLYGHIRAERYRVGDVGRLIEQSCACGASRTIELMGRRGMDYVKVAGALLRREEFDRVFEKIPLVSDYRVEIAQPVHGGVVSPRVRIRVFSERGPGTPALAAEIANRIAGSLFVTPTQTYADLVAGSGWIPLEVSFEAKPFSAGGKDIKIRLVDQ